MATAIWGVVKDGVIVPQTPVPEGAHVQILLTSGSTELPPELRVEFDAWNAGSVSALEAFEATLDEDVGNGQG